MHRALEILEIAEMICGQALSSRDLSVLARTSTIFTNPALNILWRHQYTILNLAKCMPDDLWDVDLGEDSECDTESEDSELAIYDSIRPRRPIIARDWERPLFYLHRVKSLRMGGEGRSGPYEFLDAVSLCHPGECIFPNLENLRWNWSFGTGLYARFLPLFLTPSIKDMDLGYFSGPDSDLSNILSNLAVKCPSLTNIHLSTLKPSDLMVTVISTFVCRFMHLESLNVPALNQSAFAHLAQLPDLRFLALGDEPRTQTPESSFQPCPGLGSPIFPALTHLTTRTMEHATALLGMFQNHPFVTLEIPGYAFVHPTKNIAHQFSSALVKHCSRSSLREIKIHGGYTYEHAPSADEIDLYSVGRDTLQSLFSFGNLVDVSLEQQVGFDLDDATVREMARAWPRLECLALTTEHFEHTRSLVTLEGLYALATHCSRLYTLYMSFDATVVPTIFDGKKERVVQRSLGYLNVALSLITQPRNVAKFLSAIFPRLWQIQTSYDNFL
ncbi:hypothetical protein C8R44DRAFT_731023 [Mycena epipterygia]|nr:hypothetical protein C8R44DRAFT_731023 [Mycena epipterygia]